MAFRPVYRPDDPQWHTSTGNPAGPELLAKFLNPNKGVVTKASDGHAIPVVGLGIAASEAFTRGAPIRKDGSNNATELTAVTQTVYGVALESVVAGASLGPRSTKVSVAPVSYTDTERTNKTIKVRFAVTDVNGTAPLAAHVGTECAIALSGGNWYIDISDTGNEDVSVIKVDTIRNEFIVEFVDAVIQA